MVERVAQDAVLVLHQLRVRSQRVALLIDGPDFEDGDDRDALAAVLGGLAVMIQSIEEVRLATSQGVDELLAKMVVKARDSIRRIDQVLE